MLWWQGGARILDYPNQFKFPLTKLDNSWMTFMDKES